MWIGHKKNITQPNTKLILKIDFNMCHHIFVIFHHICAIHIVHFPFSFYVSSFTYTYVLICFEMTLILSHFKSKYFWNKILSIFVMILTLLFLFCMQFFMRQKNFGPKRRCGQKFKWMWLSEWWIDECKVIIRLMNVIRWMNNVRGKCI